MMEETIADADSPCHYVESGAADVAGIPSSEPISPGAGGGARPHCVVGRLRPTGQGNCGRHGHYTEKGFSLAQAFPRAGRVGVGERRAPARPQTHDRYPPDETRGDHDHAPATDERHSLEHAHHGGSGRYPVSYTHL